MPVRALATTGRETSVSLLSVRSRCCGGLGSELHPVFGLRIRIGKDQDQVLLQGLSLANPAGLMLELGPGLMTGFGVRADTRSRVQLLDLIF